MNADQPQAEAYRCPGEQHPISPAVHLGRLAAFYPACRQCPRREETGTLSPRRVAQLAETSHRGWPRSLFHEEGAGGVYLNDLSPAAAKQIAAAFAAVVLDAKPQAVSEGDHLQISKSPNLQIPKSPNPQIPRPFILLAGDGRPLTAELLAATAEGLRATGCNVVDVGPSTAPCLAFAVGHLQAAGGLLVGNPSEDSHTAGMKFWDAGPRPLSGDCPDFRASENGTVPFAPGAGVSLESVIERYQAGPVPPARRHGQLCHYEADRPYLAQIAEYYHALRPLRILVNSASRPTLDFLQKLAATVACEVIPSRSTRAELPRQILADAAHFAACIDGDGEACRIFDEQGRPVPPERLLLLLAATAGLARIVGGDSCRRTAGFPKPLDCNRVAFPASGNFLGNAPTGAVVLEADTPPPVADRLESLGIRVAHSSPRRADMAAAMLTHAAKFGGGPSGRFWHAEAGRPLCDALMTVTQLLVALSHGDAPLSQVLDLHAPIG